MINRNNPFQCFYSSCCILYKINCIHNCQGVCEKQVHDTIQRLWDIIENITVDRIGLLPCFIFNHVTLHTTTTATTAEVVIVIVAVTKNDNGKIYKMAGCCC